jgi:hypothetical protein
MSKAKTEKDLEQLLAERFCPPEWAFIPQVSNGTGFTHRRTADAVAMNCYPSRGLELHGFEIKVSRADWMRELKNPDKSVAVQKFCNRWWIVVSDKKIVQPGELPSTWGLLAPWRSGLKAYTAAPELQAEPLSRTFIASLLRNVATSQTPQAEIRAAIQQGIDQGLEISRKDAERAAEFERRKCEGLAAAVAEFEKASGVKISRWSGGQIGEAVKAVMEHGKNPATILKTQRRIIGRMLDSLDSSFDKLQKTTLDPPSKV